MKELRFKKDFTKLHKQKSATLIAVYDVYGFELLKDFREYDTDNEFIIETEQRYLLLVFLGDKYIPFTTVRKYNAENIARYCRPNNKNEDFIIVVEGA